MDKKDLAAQLHTELAKRLLERVTSTESPATAAELNVARQFLKDNGIDTLAVDESDPTVQLAALLPFRDPEASRRLAADG